MKKMIDRLEEGILVVSLLLMLIVTVGNVFSRKVIQKSWSFAEELTIFLFILSSLAGAAAAARDGRLIGLTLLYDLVPKKAKKIFVIILLVSALFFCGLLLYFGIDMVKSEFISGQTTPAMGIPEWIFGLSIPLGAILLLIRMAEYCICQLKGKEE